MYPPTERTRERFLVSGNKKTGKTALALSIIELLAKGDSGATAYWFDSEDSIYDSEAIVAPLEGRGLLSVTQGSKFEDFALFVDRTLGHAKNDDWVIVDKADAFWKWTQSYYLRVVKGIDLTESIRRLNKEGKPPQWGGVPQVIERSEWTTVTGYYDEVIQPLILSASDRPKLHLCFITEVKDAGEDDEVNTELAHGVKPTGQKGLPYQMRTLIHLEVNRSGHVYSSLERVGSGRDRVDRKPFTNFAMTYLMGTAGWLRKQPGELPTNIPATPNGSPREDESHVPSE